MTKKALNLQKVDRQTLIKEWGDFAYVMPDGELFIRSDKNGNVNWNVAPVYTWQEILEVQKIRPVHFTCNPEIFELPEPVTSKPTTPD